MPAQPPLLPAADSFTVAVISDDPWLRSRWLADIRTEALALGDATAAPERIQHRVVLLDVRERHRHLEAAHLVAKADLALVVFGPVGSGEEGMRYLDLGAVDYLSAQAQPSELVARLRAAARYAGQVADDWLVAGSVAVSLSRHEVRRDGRTVHLTPTEYLVLEALAATPRQAVSHEELTRRLWRPEPVTARHSLRVYIRQLREKLEEDPSQPAVILTIPGDGYCFNSPEAIEARESG